VKWLLLAIAEIATFVVFATFSDSESWRTFYALCAAGGGVAVGISLTYRASFGVWP